MASAGYSCWSRGTASQDSGELRGHVCGTVYRDLGRVSGKIVKLLWQPLFLLPCLRSLGDVWFFFRNWHSKDHSSALPKSPGFLLPRRGLSSIGWSTDANVHTQTLKRNIATNILCSTYCLFEVHSYSKHTEHIATLYKKDWGWVMMISKFNGTSTPKGSYSAKTVVTALWV